MAGPKKLRELVRDIRSAKTAAEERAIVNKECAEIRNFFRSENSTYRCRNVAKLLYIHMLGYPAHFGQLECLKLIASPRFTDKRVGHLGAMLLLDEKSDVHLLLTNSLKNDLNNQSPYVVSLALCTLGSVCSPEICRDLAGEVERIIKSPNVYLRKKAALCAFRILKRVPDLLEMFIPSTRSLLAEKNQSVVMATVCLISEMCSLSKEVLNHFRKLVPTLIRSMRNLIMVNYSNDSDVNRISDPFLQVKILRLMRILGTGDRHVSEQLNDILTQVATNTEITKNVGHAILYEIVLTIMAIESDSGLKVLAVNILGRFLLNADKNIRYVALNTLKQVVHTDYQSVQRHRATILECLKDPDVSIRRRAVDLCFALINGTNIVHIIKEILVYILAQGICEDETRVDVCFNSLIACDMYSPNPKWHFEVILQMLIIIGNSARDDLVSSIISVVTQMNENMHSYVVYNLFFAINDCDLTRQPLLQAGVWIIGEYGHLLIQPMSLEPSSGSRMCPDNSHIVIPDAIHQKFSRIPTKTEIINLLEKILSSSLCSMTTKQMTVVSLGKLSARFIDSPDLTSRIETIIQPLAASLNLELQQRSLEMNKILGGDESLRKGLLEAMPVIESKITPTTDEQSNNVLEENDGLFSTKTNDLDELDAILTGGHNQTPHTQPSNALLINNNGIGNLLSDVGGKNTPSNGNHSITNKNNGHQTTNPPKRNHADDIFDQIMSMPDPMSPTTGSHLTPSSLNPVQNSISNTNNDLLDVFGLNPNGAINSSPLGAASCGPDISSALSLTNQNFLSASVVKGKPMIIHQNDYLMMVLHPVRLNDTIDYEFKVEVTAKQTQVRVDAFEMLVAVPKSLKLTLLPPNSTQLFGHGAVITQQINISNPTKAVVKLRIKLAFSINSQMHNEQFQVDNFPVELWS